VKSLDPNFQDYWRYYESPGLAHCFGGPGGYPAGVFDALVDWVENGVIPGPLNATSTPASANAPTIQRLLCLYPQKAKYNGVGDTSVASSYTCVD
jgi:hypothetical protein